MRFGLTFDEAKRAEMRRTPLDVDWGLGRLIARAPLVALRALACVLGLGIFALGGWAFLLAVS